jgi:hypothetical protein
MAKTNMKRWVCPSCKAGSNAPSRMAPDDVRRYCLPCSSQAPKLVRRVSPALERQRAQAAAKAADKAKAKRDAAARKRAKKKAFEDQRRFIMGYDVLALMKRWYGLKSWDRSQEACGRPRMPSRLPEFVVRRGKGSVISAHACRGYHRMTMTVPLAWDENPTPARVADLLVTIVHELAHLFAPARANHDRDYNRQFCRAVHAIWGSDVSRDRCTGDGYEPTHFFRKRLTGVLEQQQQKGEQ